MCCLFFLCENLPHVVFLVLFICETFPCSQVFVFVFVVAVAKCGMIYTLVCL